MASSHDSPPTRTHPPCAQKPCCPPRPRSGSAPAHPPEPPRRAHTPAATARSPPTPATATQKPPPHPADRPRCTRSPAAPDATARPPIHPRAKPRPNPAPTSRSTPPGPRVTAPAARSASDARSYGATRAPARSDNALCPVDRRPIDQRLDIAPPGRSPRAIRHRQPVIHPPRRQAQLHRRAQPQLAIQLDRPPLEATLRDLLGPGETATAPPAPTPRPPAAPMPRPTRRPGRARPAPSMPSSARVACLPPKQPRWRWARQASWRWTSTGQ
jgi:hypothetical protein